MLRYFTEEVEGEIFTLNHLVSMYSPRLYRGLIRLCHRSKKSFFTSVNEGKDRGWMSRFIRVRTSDIIPAQRMPFPKRWNTRRKQFSP